MAIHNRKATCDVCGKTITETSFGSGWPGWSIVNGVGAEIPKEDKPIENRNLETYLCKEHTEILSQFISDMQHGAAMFEIIDGES